MRRRILVPAVLALAAGAWAEGAPEKSLASRRAGERVELPARTVPFARAPSAAGAFGIASKASESYVGEQPAREYEVLVASEATDQIALVRFGPSGARIVRTTIAGINPVEPDGPHGLAVSPDARHFYVSTAHGTPYGFLFKYDASTGAAIGRVELGNFPASMQATPDGQFVYVVNFNLHGEMVPSSVSIVSTDPFVEVARLTTCTMPHGSRFNPQGTKHYSACMMDDMLVEIDTRTLSVSRHFMLSEGKEHGMAGAPGGTHGAHGIADRGTGRAGEGQAVHAATCSPTWAQPSHDGGSIFVACNKSSEIVEIDATSWTLKRRLRAGEGVYNLAATRDGKLLVATNKRGQSISIFDVVTGKESARIATLRRVVHGVAISHDDRYAFVTVEGIGSEPGTLEIIDLRAFERVASVELGQMAGGVDIVTRGE